MESTSLQCLKRKFNDSDIANATSEDVPKPRISANDIAIYLAHHDDYDVFKWNKQKMNAKMINSTSSPHHACINAYPHFAISGEKDRTAAQTASPAVEPPMERRVWETKQEELQNEPILPLVPRSCVPQRSASPERQEVSFAYPDRCKQRGFTTECCKQ